MNKVVIIFNLILFFLIGGGLNLILIFNYYFYARNKVLIMSRGNDVFYFGDITSPNKYDKKDIIQFTIKKPRGSKSPIAEFSITTIQFRNGSQIKIPSLLLDDAAFKHKLFGYPKISEGGFPFIRN